MEENEEEIEYARVADTEVVLEIARKNSIRWAETLRILSEN